MYKALKIPTFTSLFKKQEEIKASATKLKATRTKGWGLMGHELVKPHTHLEK
jgi:hypothetical protein